MKDVESLEDLRLLETRHLEFLESILSLDRALAGLPKEAAREAVFATVSARLKEFLSFQAVAFFTVNPGDLSYELAFVEPPEERQALSSENDQAIEDGIFGWALKRNQALVQKIDDSRQFVLHPLTTPRSTVGMLAAFADPSFNASSSSLTFLAVILSKVALDIENRVLHSNLNEYNQQLENAIARLLDSEGRLTTILEKMPVGLAMVDGEDTVLWLNEAFKNMVGAASKEEIVFRKCSEVIGSLGAESAPGPYAEQERKVRRKDGKELSVLFSAHPIEMGSVEQWLCIFFDISKRKSLEADLNRARKLEAVGQLAAGIAHEINTPAQFVGDSVRFLSTTCEDVLALVEKYRECIAEMASHPEYVAVAQAMKAAEEEADLAYLKQESPAAFERVSEGIARIAAIVGAMKEFAHPDQSEKSPADLNRALATTLVIARNEYKYVADVETDFGEIPAVLCHVGDINQVFLNLLVNAAHAIADVVKASHGKGKIRVRTRQEGRSVCIEIADTGCGIPEEIRERIYDPFFTTKEVGRGSGQGLAIAWSIIVDKHAGALSYDSVVGKGTTFKILLPIDGTTGGTRKEGTS
jgi:PAS domain S-box-containing protein